MAEDIHEPGTNRIQDIAAAQEMAYIQKPGMDAALAREKELGRQGNTELSQVERDNIEVMDHIKERYPNALTEIIGESGKKILVMDAGVGGIGRHGTEGVFIFTQGGAFQLVTGEGYVRNGMGFGSEDIDVDGFYSAFGEGGLEDLPFNFLSGSGKQIPAKNLFKDPDIFEPRVHGFGLTEPLVFKMDLSRPDTREFLKHELEAEQKKGEENKELVAKRQGQNLVDVIKAEL